MERIPTVSLDNGLQGTVRLAVIGCAGIEVDDGAALWEMFEPFCRKIAQEYAGRTIGAVEGIQAARSLYRAIGVDPTSHRPSSEALVRRLLKGKSLYRINSLVDTVNYCSLACLLPLGLYDLDKITGDRVNLRRGEAGEGYEGIRKDRVNLEGRYALFDRTGPFGSPTADSGRTCITRDTTRALVVIFAPAELPGELLERHAGFTVEAIVRYGGGGPSATFARLVE